MRRQGAAMLLAALGLTACATAGRIPAAADVHALLVSVRDDDHAAFNSRVDRPALRARLQARLAAKARGSGANWLGMGVLLSGPIAAAADSLLVRPEMFRAIAAYYGYRPGMRIPGVLTLAAVLKTVPGGEVCATALPGGPCVLTFADEAGVWRLVDIDPFSAAARPPPR